MIATLEYIEQKFNEYNDLMFEGKLPTLPFKLSNARSFLGQISFRREKNPDGTWHYYGFIFRISTKTDLPEREVEDTIIHEMIHYYILYNQMEDTSSHGEIFQRMMKDINVRFNRNVSVTHKTTKEEQDKDTEIRKHLICVVRLKTGKRGVMIAARSRLFQLWDEMLRFPKLAELKWYFSTEPFFNRFPRCMTPKIYYVSADELQEHLQDAKELIRTGNNIRVKA